MAKPMRFPMLLRVLTASAALALPCLASAGNGSAAVYKCTQPSGAIAYQDVPCKGGLLVDIKPEAVDPNAVERLRRAQEAFDQAMARRKADEAIAELRREEADQRLREWQAMSGQPGPYATDSGYAPVYGWYVPYASRPVPRHHAHRRMDDRRVPGRVPATVRRPTGG